MTLPEIGDASRLHLSRQEAVRIGQRVERFYRDQGRLLTDPQLDRYLDNLGTALLAHADPVDHDYRLFWVKSPVINAFAAPAGYIGINTGLLLATDDEDQLAGVLAHEIAHVTQRHIARAIADARRMTLPTIAASLAGALLIAADPSAGSAVLAGVGAANAQRRINYTRQNEREADRIGEELMVRAGFKAEAMGAFFAKLQRQSRGNRDIPGYLLTHPRPVERIADTWQLRPGGRPRNSRNPLDHALAKARAQVLTEPDSQVLLRHFAAGQGGSSPGDDTSAGLANRYGYALTLKGMGHYQRATTVVAELRRLSPNTLAFRIEEAELALAAGQEARGFQLFQDHRALFGDDYALAVHYAQALVNHGRPERAMAVLQPHLDRAQRGDAELYALYAQAARQGGDAVATHAALAEYHYLLGDYRQAINQAQYGLRTPAITPFQAARLRARLRELQALDRAAKSG
ncbi:MAG: M48 family metalloprotease [Candidatus Competibacterales bacterium]